jgi:hypothetical protein
MLELAQSLRADNAEACRRVLSNRGAEAMRRPSVQILFFEGCPNHKQASELVEQVAHELGLQPEIALVGHGCRDGGALCASSAPRQFA